MSRFAAAFGLLFLPALLPAADMRPAPPNRAFLERNCIDCHDTAQHKGDLDLETLAFDLQNPKAFSIWVKVHDRIAQGEMPPKEEPRPDAKEMRAFLDGLAAPLTAADRARAEAEGRATWRRLNRYEYENTLRDLLHAPWLNVRDMLPEDGEAFRFNKVGEALHMSHVQAARYVATAEHALRRVMAPQIERPPTTVERYYTREQRDFVGRIGLRGPRYRMVWPVDGNELRLDLLDRGTTSPMTVGAADPAKRETEAMAVVISTYQPTLLQWTNFRAPISGRYRLRFSAYSLWMARDFKSTSVGRRSEPISIYALTPPRTLRKLGSFDVTPNDTTPKEMTVWLVAGEGLRPDAARLHRQWPPDHKNPDEVEDGMPAVAFRWAEVEGPLLDEWPTAGHRAIFANAKLKQTEAPAPAAASARSGARGTTPGTTGTTPGRSGRGRGNMPTGPAPRGAVTVEAVSSSPEQDAVPLLRDFLARAYRRPITPEDEAPFLKITRGALKSGHSFNDAMIAGYAAILSSPGFLYFQEMPGPLDGHALASRLSYFLWNSPPDDELRRLAASGELPRSDVLRAQTDRMLADPKARRFVDAFVDYWLDVRHVSATAPDATLYPDYQLDDLLVESMVDETQLFFAELLRRNLPARNIVASDFAMLNERLAKHYDIAGVEGVALRPVKLPTDSMRGGLLTQATVLKVTANGTTTSPVVRGAWILERILGLPPPPPPPTVPAVEPDTRGATTIRAQLAKHREEKSCAACHAKIDPAGFALENFDVMGAWRERYRSLGEGEPVIGIGHNSQRFTFKLAQPVDSSGELADGRAFHDVRDLKRHLLSAEEQIARNLLQQLLIFATGAPARFSDRPKIEAILARQRGEGYGVRSLVHELVQSEMFRSK